MGSTESVYQYSAWDLVKETSTGQSYEYIFGADIDEIHRMRIGTDENLYYTDALGSVRQIYDSTGAMRNEYSYTPWGETTRLSEGLSNQFLFTAREAGEDGVMGYRFRHYSPGLGRFVSEDPLRFAAGDANFYRYVLNDPPSAVDPYGLISDWSSMLAQGRASMLPFPTVNGEQQMPWGMALNSIPGELVAALPGSQQFPGPCGTDLVQNDWFVNDLLGHFNITFGNTIVVNSASRMDMDLIGHELVHVEQNRREGLDFYPDYILGALLAYAATGGAHDANPYETEAEDRKDEMRKRCGCD